MDVVNPRIAVLLVMLLASCTEVSERSAATDQPQSRETSQQPHEAEADINSEQRQRMVAEQLAARDIIHRRVLDAMGRIPRHKFVPVTVRNRAYQDSPLPIGDRQTISQPYIVALMTQLVDPQRHHKALDIGTGSGYQAAVLAELVKNVYSIEIIESLASDARKRLQTMGYQNINVRHGDGYHGWESEAPFDMIIVAAAPDHIPQALVEQLAPGGKMVIPVGKYFQTLLLIEKKPDGSVVQSEVAPVRFVPMTGAARQ
jgi:protein-L-isoaspartate(D-aspartate) O-methyltransferase